MITKPILRIFKRSFVAKMAGEPLQVLGQMFHRDHVPLHRKLHCVAKMVGRDGAAAQGQEFETGACALTAVAIRAVFVARRGFDVDFALGGAMIDAGFPEFVEAVRRAEMGRVSWFGVRIDRETSEIAVAAGRAEIVALRIAGLIPAADNAASIVFMINVTPLVRAVLDALEAAGEPAAIVPPDFIVGDETDREAA